MRKVEQMKLVVNGKEAEIIAGTLSELLEELDYKGDWLATAVNSNFVPVTERFAYTLSPGDRVEILAPMQGG
jgi:sulfur carrier protein